MRHSFLKRLLIAGALAILGILPAAAGSFEVTPFYGYRLGGEFTDFDTSGVDNLEIDDGDSWGAILTFNLDENAQVELLFSHQETSLRADGSLFATSGALFDLDVDNWQLGGAYTWGERKDPVRGFLGFSLGVTSFDPQSGGYHGDSQFAFSFYGGAKVPFGKHVGLRLQAQWIETYVSSDEDVFCNSFGVCYTLSDANYVGQFELSAGIAFTF
jgi:hypothetical protein